jgi:hypothetical protein
MKFPQLTTLQTSMPNKLYPEVDCPEDSSNKDVSQQFHSVLADLALHRPDGLDYCVLAFLHVLLVQQ